MIKKITSLTAFILLIFFINFTLMAQEETLNTNQNKQKFEPNIQSSIISINVFGSLTLAAMGDIMDEEHDLTILQVTYSDGKTKKGRPDHMGYNFGLFADFFPFNFNSLKLGFRGKYTNATILQLLSVGDDSHEKKSYDAILMEYQTLTCGISTLFMPFDNKKMGFNFYVTAGPLFSGNHKYVPILQNEDKINSIPDSSFSGFIIEFGTGFQYTFDYFLVGTNFQYAYNSIKLENNQYVNVSDSSVFHTFDWQLYIGVHF